MALCTRHTGWPVPVLVPFCQPAQIRCQRNKHAIIRFSAGDPRHGLPRTEPRRVFLPRSEQFPERQPYAPPRRIKRLDQNGSCCPTRNSSRGCVSRDTQRFRNPEQPDRAAANITKRAERRKPCDHGRQNVPGPLFAEDLFQRCLLRAAPGQ